MSLSFINGENLPENEFKIKAKEISDKFTHMVKTLKSNPNPELAMLGKLTWDLVGNRVIPFSVSNQLKTLTFAVAQFKDDDRLKAFIIAPIDWDVQIEQYPTYSMGGLIYIASQSRDYWNDKIKTKDDPTIINRATAYEAEFLLSYPKLKANDYQKKVLEQFPQGLKSAKDLIYTGKPFKV